MDMMKSPARRTSNTSSRDAAGKKRESRAGTRKVTSLTAEQLERKRANDREAQRTIRARTKEHIENLEHQVAELSAKGEQVDRVLQRNAALEAEIAHLRQQLAMMTGDDERRSSTSSNPPSVISSPFNSPPGADSLSSASSIPSVSNRMSLPHSGWHSYGQPPAAASMSASDQTGHVTAYAMGYTLPHSSAYSNSDSYPSQIYQSRTVGPPQGQPHMAMGYEPGNVAPPPAQYPMPSQHHHHHPSHPYAHPPASSQIHFQWDSRG
ncbi:hypothetical protein BGW36DRAFT_151334 [Talaromyces proteolyticus]|uniref:BZIP domain-containing protein n=1 Tax=Talaromyces proteolyticus TaxID=1131652 RepID=A0AAD4KUU8_9EURO|nr:uncharacterized protein BGW36DRAFT_151334 [Talaromyces proteolyticus]KAH8698844.1 hypothetical protein BGW36DRAFT_151334 [Talaromyces proteolyticus]